MSWRQFTQILVFLRFLVFFHLEIDTGQTNINVWISHEQDTEGRIGGAMWKHNIGRGINNKNITDLQGVDPNKRHCEQNFVWYVQNAVLSKNVGEYCSTWPNRLHAVHEYQTSKAGLSRLLNKIWGKVLICHPLFFIFLLPFICFSKSWGTKHITFNLLLKVCGYVSLSSHDRRLPVYANS